MHRFWEEAWVFNQKSGGIDLGKTTDKISFEYNPLAETEDVGQTASSGSQGNAKLRHMEIKLKGQCRKERNICSVWKT